LVKLAHESERKSDDESQERFPCTSSFALAVLGTPKCHPKGAPHSKHQRQAKQE